MSMCMSHEETFAIKGLWWAKLKQSFSDFEIPMNSGHFRSPLFCSSNLVLRKIKLLSRLFKRSWVLVAGGGIRHRCWSLTGFILFHWNVKDPFHPRRVKTVRALSSVPFFFFFYVFLYPLECLLPLFILKKIKFKHMEFIWIFGKSNIQNPLFKVDVPDSWRGILFSIQYFISGDDDLGFCGILVSMSLHVIMRCTCIYSRNIQNMCNSGLI